MLLSVIASGKDCAIILVTHFIACWNARSRGSNSTDVSPAGFDAPTAQDQPAGRQRY
jgi:hypothetical protein